MHSITLTAQTANCAVQWCDVEADDHDDTNHGNIASPPVEVLDLHTGKPTVVCVDIEQRAADAEPRIVIHGPTMAGDQSFLASDARRIALAMLAQLDLIESAK